jgi:hypothetical protein
MNPKANSYMTNNSKSNIEVKANGTKRGADEMMYQEAVGSKWLKILGGIALLITSVLSGIAGLILALSKAGLI